jgi:PDZ domain-containing protein
MRRRQAFTAALIGAGLVFVAAIVPLPFYVLMPGSAVDLSRAVTVGSTAAPRDRFYLTDVHVLPASPLRLLLAVLPGVTIMPVDAVVPKGISSRRFDDVMSAAMSESQSTAAVVAERAAGLAVTLPPGRVEVEGIDAASKAHGVLAIGDVIRRVDRLDVQRDGDVRAALARVAVGVPVRLAIERGARRLDVMLPTVRIGGRSRLGLLLGERFAPARLAIPVRYTLGDIGGSSGGLMIALRIYEGLRAHRSAPEKRFAGTGTLALDGRVGAIEGTRQKLIAAERVGARVFFVPRANYAEIAGTRDVRVVPVDTFGQAVHELDG